MKLKEICDLLNGYAFKSSEYISNGYRVIRITNVQKGKIEDNDPIYYKEENKLDKYKLKNDDILISLTGNVGRVGLVNTEILPAYLNQRVGCLRIKTTEVLPKYLYYILNTEKFENDCINASKGIAQLNLSTEWVKEYEIDIPTIDEQLETVKKANIISNEIDIKKYQILKCDELIKSQFVEMFGSYLDNKYNFQIKTLDDYTEMITYGLTIRPKYVTDGINLISTRELSKGIIAYDSSQKISVEDFKKLSAKAKPNVNEILFSKTGTIGYCALIETKKIFAITQNVARIVLKNVNPKWMLYYLKTDEIQNYCKRHAKGNAVKDFQIQDMKNVPVISCGIDLQNKFANIVEQIDKQKLEFEKSLKKLEELQSSLMQEYFD